MTKSAFDEKKFIFLLQKLFTELLHWKATLSVVLNFLFNNLSSFSIQSHLKKISFFCSSSI